jgi:predicted dehydrogenase
MSRKQRCLMIGAGGMARHWIHSVWHAFRDRMEFAALVDVNPDILNQAGDLLDLPRSHRFTSISEAFAQVDADYCCIVIPPQYHREAVELACARSMNILSEKPIAASWEDCCVIYQSVQRAGVQMMVTQNYRYTQRILTLKKAVAELGPVNYALCRYAADYRTYLAWGAAFRHEMPHSLLVEATIHHFDQLRNFTGANCQTLTGYEWHPGLLRGDVANYKGSDSFKGEPNGLFLMQMTNGSFGSYEGNNLATGKTNSWHSEYYRIEAEGGVAILDKDHVVRIEERGEGGTLKVREVPAEKPQWESHHAIGDQFLTWMEGGDTPATVLSDSIQSNAMMFAAMEASATRTVIDVQAMVKEATGE